MFSICINIRFGFADAADVSTALECTSKPIEGDSDHSFSQPSLHNFTEGTVANVCGECKLLRL